MNIEEAAEIILQENDLPRWSDTSALEQLCWDLGDGLSYESTLTRLFNLAQLPSPLKQR